MAEITKCGWVRSVRENPQGYSDDLRRSVYFSLPAPTKARCLEHARKLLEEALAKDTALHEANAPIIESNKAHRAAIEAAMTAAGVAREFAERIPNRSRMGHKTVRSTAGYIADMARCLPIDDAYADAVARYNATKAAHDRFEAEAKQEEEQAKRKAEFDAKQAAEKRKADIEPVITLAALAEALGLSAEDAALTELERVERPEVMEKVRRKQVGKDALFGEPSKPTPVEWVAAACSQGVEMVQTDAYATFFYVPGDITVRLEWGPEATAIAQVLAIEIAEPNGWTALTPAELRSLLTMLRGSK